MRFGSSVLLVSVLAFQAWAQSARFLSDQVIWQDVQSQDAREIILENIYLDGIGVATNLRLQPFEVWAKDALIRVQTADGEVVQAAPTHKYFRGYIDGFATSRVVLSIKSDGRVEGIAADEGRIWMLAGDSSQVVAALDSREAAWSEIAEDGAYNCLADQLPGNLAIGDELAIIDGELHEVQFERNRLGTATYTTTIAYETDNEFLNRFSSVSEATDYIGDITAFMSSMFISEVDAAVEVGHVNFWDGVTDPWNENSTLCTLYDFGKYWNDNNSNIDRTIAHFLSGKSGGGIAWLGVLCRGPFNTTAQAGDNCGFSGTSNYGGDYGVSFGISGNFNINNPSSVWDIVVLSHEVGHNFNSPHTHCYGGIGGNNEPVDGCFNGEGGCYNGSQTLPCGQSGAGCGTIMSYCHLRPGGLGNIALTFGLGHSHGVEPERVPTRMNAHVIQRAASFPDCIPQGCVEPSLNSQTGNMTVCQDDQIFLMVIASGTALSYQWRFNGQNIPGATNSTFSINQAALADDGVYDCLITGECGSTTSNPITVQIDQAPNIATQPADATLCTSETLLLSTSATDSEAVTYQWLKDGQEISGANAATFQIATTQPGDSGIYTCRIENDCGSVTTNPAIVVVEEEAQIALDQDLYFQAGQQVNVGFSFLGCELEGPTWEWRNAQTQQVYASNVQTFTLPLLAETTLIELALTGDGGAFNAVETFTVLVTDNTTFNDPNGDGCYDSNDIIFMGHHWLGTSFDADGNQIFDIRDFLYLDTSGNCPGVPRTAKLKP
jgi:hypothetical protein